MCLDSHGKSWRVYISIDKKSINLGSFANKDDAIKARLKAEAKYYGEFAPQIHLFEQYGITQQNDSNEITCNDEVNNNE